MDSVKFLASLDKHSEWHTLIFQNADLTGANLEEANLEGANLKVLIFVHGCRSILALTTKLIYGFCNKDDAIIAVSNISCTSYFMKFHYWKVCDTCGVVLVVNCTKKKKPIEAICLTYEICFLFPKLVKYAIIDQAGKDVFPYRFLLIFYEMFLCKKWWRNWFMAFQRL